MRRRHRSPRRFPSFSHGPLDTRQVMALARPPPPLDLFSPCVIHQHPRPQSDDTIQWHAPKPTHRFVFPESLIWPWRCDVTGSSQIPFIGAFEQALCQHLSSVGVTYDDAAHRKTAGMFLLPICSRRPSIRHASPLEMHLVWLCFIYLIGGTLYTVKSCRCPSMGQVRTSSWFNQLFICLFFKHSNWQEILAVKHNIGWKH